MLLILTLINLITHCYILVRIYTQWDLQKLNKHHGYMKKVSQKVYQEWLALNRYAFKIWREKHPLPPGSPRVIATYVANQRRRYERKPDLNRSIPEIWRNNRHEAKNKGIAKVGVTWLYLARNIIDFHDWIVISHGYNSTIFYEGSNNIFLVIGERLTLTVDGYNNWIIALNNCELC